MIEVHVLLSSNQDWVLLGMLEALGARVVRSLSFSLVADEEARAWFSLRSESTEGATCCVPALLHQCEHLELILNGDGVQNISVVRPLSSF